MQKEDSRNTIIFLVSALVLFLIYNYFVLEPQAKRREAEAARARAEAAQQVPGRPAAGAPAIQVPAAVTRAAAVAATPRVQIKTPSLSGSLSLRGARIDDLFLTQLRQTVDKDSPPVELLRPEGTKFAWFADIGWTGADVQGLPNSDTIWTLSQGSVLSPGQPVVLTTTTAQGLRFTRRIEVDERYMFTVTDTVANLGQAPITLAPFGSVQRQSVPADLGKNQILHEGGVGALGEKHQLRLLKYGKWIKDSSDTSYASEGGWLGITDKYWFAALISETNEPITGQFRHNKVGGVDVLDANFVGQARAIPPGRQVTETTRFFAGAKRVPMLREYSKSLGIPRFDDAVDWGSMFFWITRPIFEVLQFIYNHVGNFGVSILLLTVLVRLLFFPLANKQYESLTKMKKLQPQMEELRKKYKDDPARQQQELLGLYQREKVNPLAGCIPILFQIPVFYGLYKVLTVTIEMRHAPFLGWIKDLSAPDPTNIWNLFGLIPWDPASAPLIGGIIGNSATHHGFMALGVLALLYGFTMWLTTSMSPPAPDPTQQRIFQLMPIMFTFIMAPFAVGLLIYWTWSNVLTILQQYVIMRRFKVDNPIDKIIRKITGKPEPAG